MRVALLLVLAAGCIPPAEPRPEPDYDYGGGGWTGSGGDPIYGCRQDSECGAQVCARNGSCYPATSIRAVTATWTIDGETASVATCTAHPYLFIRFATSSGDSFGYAPVPCENGKFTIDKLPTSYSLVELGVDGAISGNTASISSDGDAMVDLR
jgi:hypothetical protein